MAEITGTEFIIITGLSGSGKVAALKCFEDLGYFCVDNLPAKLFPTFAELCTKKGEEISRVAVIVDIRERDFLTTFPDIYQGLRNLGYRLTLLFLDASDEVLQRRFSETRRPHPLAFDRPVLQGIAEERRRTLPIRELADIIIDTSATTIHELREYVNKIFAPVEGSKPLVISIISFGYKYGIPFNSDVLLDVRFLPNPYFHPEFKERNGMDAQVRDFVFESADSKEFMAKLQDMLVFLIPRYVKEGKSYLTISIGCTGGKHRSVAVADSLERFLRDQGYQVRSKHRDLGRE